MHVCNNAPAFWRFVNLISVKLKMLCPLRQKNRICIDFTTNACAMCIKQELKIQHTHTHTEKNFHEREREKGRGETIAISSDWQQMKYTLFV